MSGGHFNYVQWNIADGITQIVLDQEVCRRWPRLTAVLTALGPALYHVIKDIDYDFSGDSYIADDAEFERRALAALQEAVRGDAERQGP